MKSIAMRLLAQTIALALCMAVAAPEADAQVLKGQILGTITDPSGGVIPGAAVVLTETNHECLSRGRDQRERPVRVPEPGSRRLQRRGRARRLQHRHPRRHRPHAEHHDPREPGAHSRRRDRDGHRDRRSPGPADRPGRHRRQDRDAAATGAAVAVQPQLPGTDDARAWSRPAQAAALAVLQLAGLARGARQRPGAAVQQLPDRGHREQDRQREPDCAGAAGRGDPDSGHLHLELRPGIRQRRRVGGQRHAAVRDQRVPRQRLRVPPQRERAGPGRSLPTPRRTPSTTSSASPPAARSSRTRCSSSATTRAAATISARSSSTGFRRFRSAPAISPARTRRSTIP